MPTVRPHAWLYDTLLTVGRPQARKTPWTWPDSGLVWLGPETGARVAAELTDTWLAQEWVGTRVLHDDRTWLVP